MDYGIKIQTLLQIEKRKWLFLMGLLALTHLFCQSLMLPYGNALLSLVPNEKDNVVMVKTKDLSVKESKFESLFVGGKPHNNETLLVRGVKSTKSLVVDGDVEEDEESMEGEVHGKMDFGLNGDGVDNDFDFVEDEALNDENVDTEDGTSASGVLVNGISRDAINANTSTEVVESIRPLLIESILKRVSKSDGLDSASSVKSKETSTGDKRIFIQSVSDASKNESKPVKKKMRCDMPPKTVTTIQEMQQLLVRNRARSRAMRPRWSSERDQEILRAKLKIENAPVLKNNRELYAPIFRNVSTFKRSYELMEQVLKVYVYKEGEKPIFHQPILKGLYASEGWFMKLMEGNKRFVVKDPRKAHLFYMPFSSRMLEYNLYVRNSHNRTNLRQFLKEYSERIAAKYRFWNRTGGADHFLVACHDWAPYETRHHMEHCIKALCNADVTMGFKIGRDVSFPETYVRSARNPLRDLGGKSPSQRHILAFYAGNMHGYLRTILLNHWKDKDPDMKILGPMPPGVASKMSYIQYMKNSKYCICPKGYEVNSPRIVEAIFYECVPVIISDNFVPPFFEMLNWDAFSVIIAEKDIPNLKNILASIPEEKYLAMQLGVRKAQQHFLWHVKPMKYDLFHMTLHSIWYNRVFQVKAR